MSRGGTNSGWSVGGRIVLGCVAGSAALAAPGCVQTEKPGFDATGPTNRLEAIVRASGTDADRRSLYSLVEQLDSEDPAARMLAIRALENRTGTTLGYSHSDPEWKRLESIERWMNYLESGGDGSDLSAQAGERP